MGAHGGGEEIGGLAGHDESREAFVSRQEDQRHPEVEVCLLRPVAQMVAQLCLEQGPGQLPEAAPELLLRGPGPRIGLPDAPEVLPRGVGITAAHSISQPEGEIHARHAARGIVRSRETGEVRVPDPIGEAGQICGDSIGHCERRGAWGESLHRYERPWCRCPKSGHDPGRAGHAMRAALAGSGRGSNICRPTLPFWQGSARTISGGGVNGPATASGV